MTNNEDRRSDERNTGHEGRQSEISDSSSRSAVTNTAPHATSDRNIFVLPTADGDDSSSSNQSSNGSSNDGGLTTGSHVRRTSLGSTLTEEYSMHDELQAAVEAKNFRSEITKKLFHHVQYITEDMKLESAFGGYPYQMYLLEMTGGDEALLEHYKKRWDRNMKEVGKAIKERRGSAIQAIRKGYVGEYSRRQENKCTLTTFLAEWDALLKREHGLQTGVPDFDVLYGAWDDNLEMYADIIEQLVLPARGKPEKSGFASIALMEDFDSVSFTCSLVVFVLHTVKDKEAVWREQIQTGERSKKTVAKPLYTMSGRFVAKGLGFDNRKAGEESGLVIRNQMMDEFEEKYENVQRYSEVLSAVKARFEHKRQKQLEGRRAKELEAAARKRRAPPTVKFGKVSQAKQRKLAQLFGSNFQDSWAV